MRINDEPSQNIKSCDSYVTDTNDSSANACKRILAKARRIQRPFCYKDFCEPLTDDNKDFQPLIDHGYFRNCISELMGEHVLALKKTRPCFYILKENASQYYHRQDVTQKSIRVTAHRSDRGESSFQVRRVMSSFLSFLEALPPSDLVEIHDVHFLFSSSDFSFVNGSWRWFDRGSFWNRSLLFPDGWTCKINAYKRTKTVTVSVGCKFFYSTSGLLRLTCLLGAIKERLQGNIPDPAAWIVTMWHYGKDLKCPVRGRDFEVCFETFSGCLARIYYKHNLGVVRFEEVQTPSKSLGELFEEVMANNMSEKEGV
jgi:hypothetical protein